MQITHSFLLFLKVKKRLFVAFYLAPSHQLKFHQIDNDRAFLTTGTLVFDNRAISHSVPQVTPLHSFLVGSDLVPFF
ncbi:hypothetical protein SDC9_159497 [bioreactor metagenome]|uniref:Uncharacterized protein n=1 Tax=bioreactor metagenome TaxID=1076179 RepID=A0A645FCS0_9ZZZZ